MILPMQKIRLAVHEDVSLRVFEVVQAFGSVELMPVKENKWLKQREKTSFEFNYVSSRLDFAVEFLSQYEESSQNKLRAMIEGTKTHITPKEIEKLENTFSYNEIVDRLQDLQEKYNIDQKKIRALEKESHLLERWKSLDIRLGLAFETTCTETWFVEQIKKKEGSITSLKKALQKQGIPAYLKSYDESRGAVTLMRADREEVQKKCDGFGIERVSMPKRRGTPVEEIERIHRAIRNAQKRIGLYEGEIRRMTTHLPKLRALADSMLWKKDKHNVLMSAQVTARVMLFEGWARKDTLSDLTKKLNEVTREYALDKIRPKKDEEPPVELKNKASVKPFETITRLYGLPAYKELDPTLYLSGFFFIFFGLCLTDVFYGLFLFLVTASVLHFYRVPRTMRPLVKLLMYGGVASSILGLFFGGYLGISVDAFPKWLQALQQFDAINDPMPFFYLSLGLGFVQILFGLFLKMATQIRNGAVMDGIMDQCPWILFFVAIAFFVSDKIGVSLGFLTEYALLILYVSLGLIVVTQGRREKNILMALAKGTMSLYDIMGYFSDVLSYARLLALGLATSALAFAVNLIAGIVNDLVPYVGIVFAVLILIVGHLFNLAVNALGAFIHSARLQFVEFFGKFITGGGRAFVPFARRERYVILERDR